MCSKACHCPWGPQWDSPLLGWERMVSLQKGLLGDAAFGKRNFVI